MTHTSKQSPKSIWWIFPLKWSSIKLDGCLRQRNGYYWAHRKQEVCQENTKLSTVKTNIVNCYDLIGNIKRYCVALQVTNPQIYLKPWFSSLDYLLIVRPNICEVEILIKAISLQNVFMLSVSVLSSILFELHTATTGTVFTCNGKILRNKFISIAYMKYTLWCVVIADIAKPF